MLTIFKNSPQAPMKRVWDPFLTQIDIREQCQSLCKRQIIFENLPEPTLGFDNGTECIQSLLLKPSRDVVVSLVCYSYSKSVRLGRFNSVESDHLNGNVRARYF